MFSHHEVLVLTDEEKKNADVLQQTMKNAKPVMCTSHSELSYHLFCMQCHVSGVLISNFKGAVM